VTRVAWRALALILLPLGARAWEEERALEFIVAHSPLLQAQRAVTQAHPPPNGLRRVLEHTGLALPLWLLNPLYFWAVVGGYWSHLWLDMLNLRGVDLFWPSPIRVVTPGNRKWRFQVGGKGEMVLLAGLLGLALALYPLSHLGFRDGLQAVLKNFDIAREQFQRQAGTHWYRLELAATDHLTLQAVRGEFPVVGVWQNGLIVERDGQLRAVGANPARHNLYPVRGRLLARRAAAGGDRAGGDAGADPALAGRAHR
jgi:hypothetical protein